MIVISGVVESEKRQNMIERLYLGPPHLEASFPYSVRGFLTCSEC